MILATTNNVVIIRVEAIKWDLESYACNLYNEDNQDKQPASSSLRRRLNLNHWTLVTLAAELLKNSPTCMDFCLLWRLHVKYLHFRSLLQQLLNVLHLFWKCNLCCLNRERFKIIKKIYNRQYHLNFNKIIHVIDGVNQEDCKQFKLVAR